MKADRIVSDGKARLLEIHEHSPLRVVLYGLMFIVLLMQFRYIYMASDDFGYATLSYAASTSYDGAKGLFDYLKNHYNSWGGRVVCFFLEIVLLNIDVWAFRLAEICVLLALIRSFEKIIEALTGKESIWNIVLPFLSLGLIPIEIARESVYWFSAAGTYLLPLGVCVPLLNKLAIYASGNTPMSRFAATAIVVGCFLGGFSAESIAVAFCCAVLGLLVTAHKQRRLFLAFCLCMSITGALCLLLAPGNFQRLGTEKVPFLDRLSENVNLILFYLYSDITYTFILFFAFCCIGVGIYSFKKSRRIAVKVLDVLGVGCSAVFSILMLFEKTGLYPILQISGMDALYICTILLLYSFLLVWEFGRFFFLRGTDETGLSARVGIVQWVMSIVALGALGATPTLPIRTLLPFVLTASLSGAVAFGVLLSDITAAVSERNFCLCNRAVLSRCIRMLLLCCFMFFTVPNMLEIYQGYAENYPMQETNHQRLLGAQNASEPIELMRLKDDVFCYVMPYMYDGEFQPLIEGEMKRYYGLPEETTFIWR